MTQDRKKDRGFGQLIGQRVLDAVAKEEAAGVPARPHLELARRGDAITKMASDVIYSESEWVDPAMCRPSPINARDYAALTYDDCAELIETIKSEGQQRTAAIVRPTNDPNVPYEIIAGNRRHWSITWLRANNFPDFRYLISAQKMDDEAAFRCSDIENRARKDISDLERGRSYRDALHRFYGGEIGKMAERIGEHPRALYRLIDLANLDPIYIEAIGGHRAIKVAHSIELKAAGKTEDERAGMLAEAKAIAQEQADRVAAGLGLLKAPDVLRRIIKAKSRVKTSKPPNRHKAVSVPSKGGKPMLEVTPGTLRTAANIRLLPNSDATASEIRASVLEALEEILTQRNIKD